MKAKINSTLTVIAASIILTSLNAFVPLKETTDKFLAKTIPVAGIWETRNVKFFSEDSRTKNMFIINALKKLKEPSIYELSKNKNASVYRVLKVSGRGWAYSIRIDMNAKQIYFKKIKHGSALQYKKFRLNKKDISLLKKRISKNFWNEHIEGFPFVQNGTVLVIEAAEEAKYHIFENSMHEYDRTYILDVVFQELIESKTNEKLF